MRLILLLLLLPFAAFAQVNKCVAADGSVRYSDRPCPSTTTSAPVKIRNDMPTIPYIPVIKDESKSQAAAGGFAESVPVDLPARKTSYRCASDNDRVWYLHSPCPPWIMGRPGELHVVTQTVVKRRDACRAIEAVDSFNRLGSGRDERDTTQDKANGRDRC